MRITNTLYRAARFSADVRAIRKGPTAVGKRLMRQALGRALGRAERRIGL